MSGVFISGIELPKECEYLDLVITQDGEVYCYDHEGVSVAKAVNVRTREDALKILDEVQDKMRWTDDEEG